MKTQNILLKAAFALMAGQASYGQIEDTPHDFSAETWNPSGEICKVCHTPHNAMAGYSPLWNHAVSASAYTLYSSATFDGAGTIGEPDGSSKLCLGCHDGTVALENFSGVTTGANFITGATLTGSDISNDHPVSFIYDAGLAVADKGLFDPASTPSGLGGTIATDMLSGNKLQCTSCHNPHDSSFGKFLRKSNTGSALCLTCHDMGNPGSGKTEVVAGNSTGGKGFQNIQLPISFINPAGMLKNNR